MNIGARVTGAAFMKGVHGVIFPAKGFEKHVFQVALDGGEGICNAEFKVLPQHVNDEGELHPAYTATLIDMVTTYALMSVPRDPGLSLVMDMSFLRSAKLGDDLLVDSQLIKLSDKLAFIECRMRQKHDGSLVALGRQTKLTNSAEDQEKRFPSH